MSAITDLIEEGLDSPTRRMLKVIERAEELGWTTGRITLAVRLSKPDDKPDRDESVAFPFYACWELRGWTPTGKASWTFRHACTNRLQPLSEADILAYLAEPELALPVPPEGME